MSPEYTATAVPTYPDVCEATSDIRAGGPWRRLQEYFRLVGALMLTRGVIRALDMIGLAYAVHSVTIPWIHLRLSVPYEEQVPSWVPLVVSGHGATLYAVVQGLPLFWFLFLGTPRALTADWFQYWTARRSVEFVQARAEEMRQRPRRLSRWLIKMRSWIESRRGWLLVVIVWALKANPFPVGPPFHAASVAGTTRLPGRLTLRILVLGALCKLLFVWGLVQVM